MHHDDELRWQTCYYTAEHQSLLSNAAGTDTIHIMKLCPFRRHTFQVITFDHSCSERLPYDVFISDEKAQFKKSFFTFLNKKHLKNVGPIRHNEPPHANAPGVATVLSHAACASMSTTTTTTTRDRGDRYGPMEWAQEWLLTSEF